MTQIIKMEHTMVTIEAYDAQSSELVVDVFYKSIHAIDESFYTQIQKEAWAPYPIDFQGWQERLLKSKPFLAYVKNELAGFLELRPNGYIDCMYVHPKFQKQGVGSKLYEEALTKAKENGFKKLLVDASVVAKPFFEKQGFQTLKTNHVMRKGVVLVNFTMQMKL